jgi:hypothetical protein
MGTDGATKRAVLGTAAALMIAAAPVPAAAKTFVDYFQPTPITCSPLSSATWGVSGVLPRDTCNGIESANGAGAPPSYYYWDGKIIRASDELAGLERVQPRLVEL